MQLNSRKPRPFNPIPFEGGFNPQPYKPVGSPGFNPMPFEGGMNGPYKGGYPMAPNMGTTTPNFGTPNLGQDQLAQAMMKRRLQIRAY